jgi:PHD/YefM family antitoxin component YafN of YafNO toxin-antitoxin module
MAKELSLEKTVIHKNNRLEVVVISTDEYERFKALEDQKETKEEREIYDLVRKRNKTPLPKYVTIDELAKELDMV